MAQHLTSPIFNYDQWYTRLDELTKQYRSNNPFPHIHLTNFLPRDVALRAFEEFPKPDAQYWVQYKHFNVKKLGKNRREEFPPTIRAIIDEVNSERFVTWLSKLTGIDNLLPDPTLEGGGMHQIEPGGFLNIHADFTMHTQKPNLSRRCNLLIYLNEGWQESWGGDLELWDKEMKSCVQKYAPLFNHAVVFSTTENSYHGHPNPLLCPAGMTRKSLACYYYTLELDKKHLPRSTNFQALPTDKMKKRIFIWLDKKVLAIYTKLKRRCGISDEFAGRVLSKLSRGKGADKS